MQISQENGDGGGTSTAFYAADQWMSNFAGLSFSIARSASIPASGSKRIGWTFSSGKPSLAAGDFFAVQQIIEGNRVADLLWGTANAKPIVVRFWAMTTTTPGTYTLSIRNYGGGTPTRTYLVAFTLAAINTWTLVTLAIPGDTTGTWVTTDTTAALIIGLGFAAGTSLSGVPGWQAGNLVGLTTATNGAAATNSTFYFGDVGLYADPNNTGVPPPWQMPDYASELAACQRYWQRLTTPLIVNGYGGAATAIYESFTLPTTMRSAPAIATSTINYSNTSGLTMNAANIDNVMMMATLTAAGAGYATFGLTMNTRM
jgi:hypothetical protein